MWSRKEISILSKTCLSSFQKALVKHLTLLPNHFLIFTRPVWGCVLQYQHSEAGGKKKKGQFIQLFIHNWSLKDCYWTSVGKPFWSRASHQNFSRAPPAQQHTRAPALPCQKGTKAHKNHQPRVGKHPRGGGKAPTIPSGLRHTGADAGKLPIHPQLPGWLSSHPTRPAFSLEGLEWVALWLALLALCGWHSHKLASHRASTTFSPYKPISTRKQKLPKGQVTNHRQNHFWHSSFS